MRVQLTTIGDPAEAVFDEMEQATGLRGEDNEQGRLYAVEGQDVGQAADRIAAHLPEGWQGRLVFEL